MNNQLIKPFELTIKDKKNQKKGQVLRAVVFSHCTMIEVQTNPEERYYLIYYKHSLVYGEKLKKIDKLSFLNKICKTGMVLPAAHPFLSAVIPGNTAVIPNKNTLFSHLQKHFTLQEVAYIATTLDSYFPKEKLIDIIYKIFFHYRRNGNFMNAYQIIRILREFAPELDSAREIKNSSDFYAYKDFYKSSLQEIQQRDSMFVEWECFKRRFEPETSSYLKELWKKQESHLETVLLWLEHTEKGENHASIDSYTQSALHCTSLENWVLTLGYVGINPFSAIPQAKQLIQELMDAGHYETAALHLLDYLDSLPETYKDILDSLWDQLQPDFIAAHADSFMKWIERTLHQDGENEKIAQLIGTLLEIYGLTALSDKLHLLENAAPQSPLLQKIKKMKALQDDPDHMMELGQYYAEFHQYDEAIECFSWEMELNPDDPAPVSQLSKMYRHKGMVDEATAYQQLIKQLK